MKLFADECWDAALVNALRVEGHDVLYAVESLRGAADDQVLLRAFSENRILVTEDKDFGELVYKLRRPVHGVILLRFDVSDREIKAPRLIAALQIHSTRVFGNFIVVDKDKVRSRPLR